MLGGFVNVIRREYAALNLWDKNGCNDATGLDYTGRVTVLRPTILKDEYKTPDFQLFLCESGFGCRPEASGRKMYGIFLKDGEKSQYERSDFIGELKQEHLPDWAKAELQALKAPDSSQPTLTME